MLQTTGGENDFLEFLV